MCGSSRDIRVDDRKACWRMNGNESGDGDREDEVSFPAIVEGRTQTWTCPKLAGLAFIRQQHLTWTHFLVFLPPGQFLLEQARLHEAAEMAERAAELESSEFDVVFSAAHMLRWAKPRPRTESLPQLRPLQSRKG